MLTRFNCKSVIELLQTALARVNPCANSMGQIEVGVRVDYNVVHPRTFLVQSFVLFLQNLRTSLVQSFVLLLQSTND
jgi:hypothetical protein